MVPQGFAEDVEADWTEAGVFMWNVSRTQLTVVSSVVSQPLRFLSRIGPSSKNFLCHL